MAKKQRRPAHLNRFKIIVNGIQRYINRTRFYPRGNVYLDKVALAHISKAVSLAKAILRLLEAGLPEEAFGLSRTLVEVALNLRFITNKYSEQRARRFVHYFARWQLENIRRAVKHYYVVDDAGRRQPKYTKAQLRKQVPQYKLVVKQARKYPNRTSWTETGNRKSKGGAWRMALEPDTIETVEGKPLKWEFDYDWIYFWTSQYVHGTVVCMDSHAVLPREAFAIYASRERGKHTGDLALFNAGLYLYKILVMSFRSIRYELPEKLHKPLGDLLHEMAREAQQP